MAFALNPMVKSFFLIPIITSAKNICFINFIDIPQLFAVKNL